MPTQNTDLKYRLIGEDVSAGSTFRKVSKEAQSAHSAIGLLGNSLNAAGAFGPMQQGLAAVGQAFQHIQDNGRRAAVVMQGVGVGIAGVGAVLLAVGGREQQATAGLKASIEATGAIFSTYSKQIADTVDQQARFGHAANDTEDALSRLTQATNDPVAALGLMGLAANIAAARNISLNDAATTLAQGLAGNTRAFRQFGITLDGVGSKTDQINRAFEELSQKLSGQAQSKADTFTGHIKAMGVEIENTIGALTKFAPLLLTVGTVTTAAGAATDLLAKRRERLALADAQVVIGETRVAFSELTSTAAAKAAAVATRGLPDLRTPAGLVGAEGAGGVALLARGGLGSSLLRGGGFALGGILAGQIAGSAIPGSAGSAVGDALSFGGTGAGLGLMVGGPLGAAIGGGLGALGGAIFGALHHGTSHEQQQQNIRAALANLQKAQDAKDQAALALSMTNTLPGEFDQLGNPKAAKVATATEALAKAKTRLRRAQEDLNKTQNQAADPLKIEAATARLTAAEANLTKAQYVGGGARIASAQAAVASAEATLSHLRQGKDLTSLDRRVSDAKQAVHDAHRKLDAAKTSTAGLSLGQFMHRQSGNLGTLAADVRAQDTLVREGVSGAVIAQIDAVNKQLPGTLRNIARNITPALAAELNREHARFDLLQTRFGKAAQASAKAAGKSLGQSMATSQMQAYLNKFQGLGMTMDEHTLPAAPSRNPLANPGRFGVGAGRNSVLGINIQTLNVKANDPNQFTQQLNDTARHKALAVPHGA